LGGAGYRKASHGNRQHLLIFSASIIYIFSDQQVAFVQNKTNTIVEKIPKKVRSYNKP